MLAIAFTGGPGFGKTTTLAALEARGYTCVPESARAIIQERVSKGLAKRPAASDFARQILALDQSQYSRALESDGPVFFDRGVVDALGMCHEAGVTDPRGVQEALAEYPFHRWAFVFPLWTHYARRFGEDHLASGKWCFTKRPSLKQLSDAGGPIAAITWDNLIVVSAREPVTRR